MQQINSEHSLHDRATVRGVSRGRRNKKRRPSGSAIQRASKSALAYAGKIAAGTGLAVGVVLGGAALWDWATTSPVFAVATIEVSGAHRATRDAIVHLAGINEGDNIFGVDASALERTIKAHPWVAKA